MTVERPSPADSRHLQAFVLEAGRALSLAGTAVSETQERLTRIAAAGGAADARVVAFPTALMIALDRAGPTTIEAIPQLTGALRLDQISVLYEVVRQAERGELEPEQGLARLRAVRAMKPRHGPAVILLAHVVMTVALCLILRPTPLDVVIVAGLGALVGTFTLLARGHHTVSVLIPVFSATIVSALTFVAVKHGITDAGLRTLVVPLVTFLPGGALTTATVELASGEMLAGASRLVYGALQLLLLAFGIVVGVRLAGLPSAQVLTDNPANLLGCWASWLGVVLFGIATAVYFSAPPRSSAAPPAAGLQDLIQPLASILAIALGVLCGASVYRGLATSGRPFRLKRIP